MATVMTPVANPNVNDPGGARNSAYAAQAVTPADNTLLPGGVTKALYIGVAGDLVVVMADGNLATFTAHPVGYAPLHVQSVNTATTATNIIALYG